MIRVMYRWTIKPGDEEQFIEHWKEGTHQIQSHCEGAYGSFLIHSRKNPEQYFGVARWESRAAWKVAQPIIMGLKLQGPLPETTVFYDELADMPGEHPRKNELP